MERIKLLLLLGCIAFLGFGCSKESEYPHATVADARKVNYSGEYTLVDTLGDQQGPYKYLGGVVLNAGLGKRCWYVVNGVRHDRDLSELKEEVLIEQFENDTGNAMLLVYKRNDPNAERSKTKPLR